MVDLATSMHTLLDEIKKRARAHEMSAEYHRRMDVQITSAAKIISAIVGAGVFVGLVSKMGLDGKGSLSVPMGWEWLYWTVLALSLAAPALTALQFALHNAEDTAKHLTSFSDYGRLAADMEVFLSRPNSDPPTMERAYMEFNARNAKLQSLISLAPKARSEAGL